jgi:TetR/AcrR family transcriptional regulator, tetracycline repressor protein
VVRKQAEIPAKERLSRETIVDSALVLADAEGLEAVTIRRLAHDQGVTPMALYWHFRDKELLLDGLAERVLTEVVLPERRPAADVPWDERLRELLGVLLDVLRAHPAIADLVHTRVLGCAAGLELSERAFGLLREAGFSSEQTAQIGIHALHTMVLLVTTEPGQRVGNEADEAILQRMRTKKAALQMLSPDRYPNVLSCAEEMTRSPDKSAYFTLGLNLLIEGIRGVAPVTSLQERG